MPSGIKTVDLLMLKKTGRQIWVGCIGGIFLLHFSVVSLGLVVLFCFLNL